MTIHSLIQFIWIFVPILFFVLITSLWRAKREILVLIKLNQKEIIFLILLFLASWATRQFFVYHTHNVYFDEFKHIQISRNLMEYGRFAQSEFPGFDDPGRFRSVKWPPGFHFCLAPVFWIFGDMESTAFTFNSIMGALSVIAAWFFLRSIGFHRSCALGSALLFSLWPLHLRISAGTSLEPAAVAMTLLASGIVCLFLRYPSRHLFWASAAALGLTGLFRVESLAATLILPSVAFLIFKKKKLYIPEPKVPNMICAGLMFMPWFIAVLASMSRYHSFSSKIDAIPLLESLSFWLGGGLMPYVLTGLMFCGLVYLSVRDRALSIGASANIFVMAIVYAGFIHVDTSYLDMQRYQLLSAPGLLCLTAEGLEFVNKVSKNKAYIYPFALAIILIGYIPHLSKAQQPFRQETEQEYRFILSMQHKLPKNALYFTGFPEVLSTTLNVPAASTRHLVEEEFVGRLDPNKRLIYFRDIFPIVYNRFGQLDRQVYQRFHWVEIAGIHTDIGAIGFYELQKKEPK